MQSILLEAYSQTIYQIDTPFFQLRIGQSHPDWDRWLQSNGYTEWSIITAWNPHSNLASASENHTQQSELRHHLESHQIPFLSGRNIDPKGLWPNEPTFIILNQPQPWSEQCARAFGQLAFVHGHLQHPATLVGPL
jgi:hypothetical protein